MTAVRETVLDGMIDALVAAAGAWPVSGAAPTIVRNPLGSLDLADFPVVALVDGGQDVTDRGGAGVDSYRMTATVGVFLADPDGAALGAAISAAHAWVVQTLHAVQYTAAVASATIEQTAMVGPDFVESDDIRPFATIEIEFDCHFSTVHGDPETLA